jgi:hypothetical protein
MPRPTVFLSYASEDRPAARALQDTLPAYGIEVWYDESELGGGDAWDQKIRRQIRECDYFMPLISAQTERRAEGYFRREWRLAVERTLDMADDHLFLLPIAIDDTVQAGARVPEKFLSVQWLKVPGGQPTKALESLCKRLAAGGAAQPDAAAKAPPPRSPQGQGTPRGSPGTDPFPLQEPGQPVRFWVEVVGWALRSGWVQFKRLPGWVRWVAYAWLIGGMISRCDSDKHERPAALSTDRSTSSSDGSTDITAAKLEKLKAIARKFQDSKDKDDVGKLTSEVTDAFVDDDDTSESANPLLAIAFTAPPGDDSAATFANTAFALTYGMIVISHHGNVGINNDPVTSPELRALLVRGKESHAKYVLVGSIEQPNAAKATTDKAAAAKPATDKAAADKPAADKAAIDNAAVAKVLTVKIAKVADGSVVWSKSYDIASTDPVKIAAEVDSHIPAL